MPKVKFGFREDDGTLDSSSFYEELGGEPISDVMELVERLRAQAVKSGKVRASKDESHYRKRLIGAKVRFDPKKHPRLPAGPHGGEFTSTGGAGKLTGKAKTGQRPPDLAFVPAPLLDSIEEMDPKKHKVWRGKPVDTLEHISSNHAGVIGEKLVATILHAIGMPVYKVSHRSNDAVDLAYEHYLYEVKTGKISNGYSAQHWRITPGEEGKKEKYWYDNEATKEEQTKWRADRIEAAYQRKVKLTDQMSKKYGKTPVIKTVAVILNPDRKTADVFAFDGFHKRIGWRENGNQQAAFLGTFKYEE